MTDYLDRAYDVNDPEFVAVYDQLPVWSAMFGLVLLEHVPMRPGMKVLDVGCGTGFPLLELAGRLGPTSLVCGIDPWAPAVARAKQKARFLRIPNVHVIEGDAAAMPFPAGEFDLIVSNLGINNFGNPAAVLAECRRVARPAARLVVTTNLRGHMQEFYDAFQATLTELGKTDCLPALTAHVEERTTTQAACDMLREAGFHVCAVHEKALTMRYADGGALLRDAFIGVGFLGGWKSIVPAEEQQAVFLNLEENLNRLAETGGGLTLTVPLACIEAEKMPQG